MGTKAHTVALLSLVVVLVWVAGVSADAVGSLGVQLFNSTKLGTNGKSCQSCHPDGKGLEEAASADEKELAGTVNQCIVMTLHGTPLAAGSPELQALVKHLKAHAAVQK